MNRPVAVLAALALALAGNSNAALEDEALEAEVHKAADRALKWLRAQQKADGSWEQHPGITALVLTAYARSPREYRTDDGPFMRNAVAYLESQAKPDGGIYDRDLPVYNTAVAVMALCSLHDSRHAPRILGAREFLVREQSDEGEGYAPTDRFYGGIGYGNDERPDLSNLQFALESLRAAGLPKEDPAWDRAITFLERCQNRSESNDQAWAANDGGFVYAPGQSMAGETKSYGSMTYAGIKSLIYANVDRDDPRIESARGWIREHYTLEENPGMGAQGLYYYFHTFAKALRVSGEPVLVDSLGRPHRWAEDLARTLLARQHEDGYWVNEVSTRWWEGNKVLATSEALLALEEALDELGPPQDACPSLTAAQGAAAGGEER